MASRRVRIKGLSHIPPRKRPLDAEATDKPAPVAPEIEPKIEKSNLTFAFEIAQEGQSTTALTEFGEHLIAKKDSPVEDVSSNPTKTEEDNGVQVRAAVTPANEITSTPKKSKVGAPYRRLIKPGVSVGAAISRKAAGATTSNTGSNVTESDKKEIIPSEQKSNNKIVILENIITNIKIEPPTFVVPTTAGSQDNSRTLDNHDTRANQATLLSTNATDINKAVEVEHSDAKIPTPPSEPSRLNSANRFRIKPKVKINPRNNGMGSTNSQIVNNVNNIPISTSSDGGGGDECLSPQKQPCGTEQSQTMECEEDKDSTKTSDPNTCPNISAADTINSNTNTPVLQYQHQQSLVHSDSEYPPPPPSPTKLNRSRIKAVPRISQRHTSCSASESEADESVKSFQHNSNSNKRTRNDSVCSTNSQDNNTTTTQTANNANNNPVSMATGGGHSGVDCASPQKQRNSGGEYNAVLQRKCRRTEQSRKLAEARREFLMKFKNSKPDRQKLTMIDLIFYNPTTNLMKNDRVQDEVQHVDEQVEGNSAEEDDPAAQSDEENAIPAPQLKIGPTGEIIIDEQSLYIENKNVKKARKAIEKSKLVDGDLRTGYGIYKRQKRAKDWSKDETLKFYRALNTFGTDFSTMCDFFPGRTRRELKLKFKKEEKCNRQLVDRAIMEPSRMDFGEFKLAVEMEEREAEVLRKQKEKERELAEEVRAQKEREAKRRKREKEERARKVEEEMASIHNKTQENQDDVTENVTTSPAVTVTATDTTEEKSKQKKRGRKRKAALDIMNVLSGSDVSSNGSSDEGAACADQSASEDEEIIEEDEEEEELQIGLLQGIQGPTRSGRIPKVTARYDPSAAILEGYDAPMDLVVYKPPATRTERKQNFEKEQQFELNSEDSQLPSPATIEDTTQKGTLAGKTMEPGTLMLLETTGEGGQTVCKVFMVTGDSQKQQSTSDSSTHLPQDGAADSSLNSAIVTNNRNGKNGGPGADSLSASVAALQSLFTLTTTVISNHNDIGAAMTTTEEEIFDRGGITIPAEEEDRGGITIPAEQDSTPPNVVDTLEQQQ